MNEPYIPRKTAEALAAEHPEGTRHHAKLVIALPLIGNGIPAAGVVATLREKFPQASMSEIESVVKWCVAANPKPSTPNGSKSGSRNIHGRHGNGAGSALETVLIANQYQDRTPATPKTMADELIAGRIFGEAEWLAASPVSFDDENDAVLLLSHLYGPQDAVNLVCKFTISDKGKANPHGGGKTLLRDDWLKWFREEGPPSGEAGAWIRPNPCKVVGSGSGGAIKDSDIIAHRFVMIESDTLSLDDQLALYSRLRLPLAAIILSGGDSAHAWLKVDAASPEEYETLTARIYAALTPYGFDAANKNPSRLSRLPGVTRKIGAKGDGRQRLLYLNGSPERLDIERLEAIAAHVPNMVPGDTLGPRMREHMKPKPRPFTIPVLEGKTDHDGFYFRDGEVTIWSGMSGHGKSTMLSTVMCYLISEQKPFFVCSLEHKPEQVCETMAFIMGSDTGSPVRPDDFVETVGSAFIFGDIVGEISPERLFAMMRSAHARRGCCHFFIDSLMRVAGLEEDYPAQGSFLNALQAFAKSTNGHVHLVAHPRKIDENVRAKKMDVKGSSMLVNSADNVVAMRRNIAKDDKRESGELTAELAASMHDAEFSVEKQRQTGWMGVIKLMFDPKTKTFSKFIPKQKTISEPSRKRWERD